MFFNILSSVYFKGVAKHVKLLNMDKQLILFMSDRCSILRLYILLIAYVTKIIELQEMMVDDLSCLNLSEFKGFICQRI
jgi:hypothetical protein